MAGAQIPGDLGLAADLKTFVFASGPELTRDRLYVSLGMAEGTYRFNLDEGFPYDQIFDLRGGEIQQIQSVFVRWLLDFDFITAVDEVAVEYDSTTRLYTIAFRATSRYGRISETVTLTTG
jgi:hypothetical protein